MKDIATSIDFKSLDKIPDLSKDAIYILWIQKGFWKSKKDCGKLTVVKSTVSEFYEKTDTFSDGFKLSNIDIVVAATGFRCNFPFLAHFLDHETSIMFYKKIPPVEKCLDGVAFVMMIRTGLAVQFAEMLARWLCKTGGKLTVVKSTVSEFHEKGVTFSMDPH